MWQYMRERGPHFSLTTILPSLVVGPLLSTAHTPAFTFIRSLGEARWQDRKMTNAVDVRDVARAHVLALTVAEVRRQENPLTTAKLTFRRLIGATF